MQAGILRPKGYFFLPGLNPTREVIYLTESLAGKDLRSYPAASANGSICDNMFILVEFSQTINQITKWQ